MRYLVFALCLVISSCKTAADLKPVTVVIGSWYGFYPLYYAIEHQLDEAFGLRVKVLEPTTIANLRRSYLREQVDFTATSMLEFTNASTLSGLELFPFLITDYSNGGDVIVAKKSIQQVSQLKGTRIAAPSQGIAEYILSIVFNTAEPQEYITQIRIPETECGEAFEKDMIDACVTYPPVSTYLLSNPDLHTIYTSAEHPQRIFDVVWAKPHIAPEVQAQFVAMWDAAVDKILADPQMFNQFVADIASVSVDSVAETMAGIKLIDANERARLLAEPQNLGEDLVIACGVAKGEGCHRFANAFEPR
ncbi:ABC transporter substrate-binding protein [Alteromonas oceanisediminis]|uniref:ABC transporter substrate-binding protein n=1 Tax=Alteromonas oceanisediminis TaxID=2836180 RepID=UPI001BDA009E|nr:ABC transporter substrate-binding protein [Alteromonas oceanisediminis]MBT0587598.1 ABC transporter substrate-binding protein [Alteromonas oceanisediminis]